MTNDQASLTAQLKDMLTLKPDALFEAQRVWLKLRNDIVAGAKDRGSCESLLNRYLSILRYCTESEELMARYVEIDGENKLPDDKQILIPVIDPHIINAYCHYTNTPAHRTHGGFFFLNREVKQFSDLSDNKKFDQILFVYRALMKSGGIAVLDAGRNEISKLVAHFADPAKQDGIQGRSVPSNDAANILYKNIDNLNEQISGEDYYLKIKSKYAKLIESIGILEIQQYLRLSRLVGLLNEGAFYDSESILRSQLHKHGFDDADKRIKVFSDLLRSVRNKPSITSDSFQILRRAYKLFKLSTNLSGEENKAPLNLRDSLPSVDRREGEEDDLKALHEVHVLNACADLAGLNARFKYVTLSNRLFNFTRGFDKADLFVRLMHPRMAILMDSDKLLREHYPAAAAAVAAAGEIIPRDDQVTDDELDKFDKWAWPGLQATRNAFAFDMKTKGTPRFDGVIQAMRATFNREGVSDQTKSRGLSELDVFQDVFAEKSQDIFEEYGKEVDKSLSESAWAGYFKFAEEIRPTDETTGDVPILVRKVANQQFSGTVARYTCIPLGGKYRHMFVLHNANMGELFPQIGDAPRVLGMRELLRKVETSSTEATKDTGQTRATQLTAKATQQFVRACFAAMDRDWMLAHTLADLAETAIDECKRETSLLDEDRVRAELILQEILFFRHLARRALAEASAPGRRVDNWLRRASKDLVQAAESLASFPPFVRNNEALVQPVSVRIALAAVGLGIEWGLEQSLVAGRDVPSSKLGLILPPLPNKLNGAWASWPTADLGGLSFKDLADFAESVVEKCKTQCARLKSNQGEVSHNGLFWSFFLVRSQQIELTARIFSWENSFEPVIHDGAYRQSIRENLNDYRSGVSSFLENSDDFKALAGDPPKNFFMEGLLAVAHIYSLFHKSADYSSEWIVSDLGDAMEAFGKIDNCCNHLNRFGFPRAFLRRAKERYAKPISDELAYHYNLQ